MDITSKNGDKPHLNLKNTTAAQFAQQRLNAVATLIGTGSGYEVTVTYDVDERLEFAALRNELLHGVYARLPQFPDPTPEDPDDTSSFYKVEMAQDHKARTAVFRFTRMAGHPSEGV